MVNVANGAKSAQEKFVNSYQQTYQQIQELNKTSLSLHIKALFRQEKAMEESDLILASLLYWAQNNLTYLDWNWMEDVTGAVAQAVNINPKGLYRNLETPGMEDADSLEDAAMLCLSNVADIIVPDTPVHIGSSAESRQQEADDSFDDW